MVEVAAGILRKEGRILIARRAAWKSMAGKWEFPGGKIEEDETAAIALVRELKEEFNITARAGEHFTTVEYSYDTFKICLLFLFLPNMFGSFHRPITIKSSGQDRGTARLRFHQCRYSHCGGINQKQNFY